jgi:aromatic ring hydroxylase
LSQYGRRHKSASSQILLSNLMQDIEILRCCIQVAESRGYMSPGGTWAPLLSAAYRVHSIEASDRAERTMEGLLTSYLILTGGASDLSGSEIGPLIERYFRGGAPSTREHLRLIAVAADMVMHPWGNVVSCTNAYRAAKSIACASVYPPNTKMRRRLSGCSDLSKQWEISER